MIGFALVACGVPISVRAMNSEADVELQCRIVPADGGGPLKAWVFQLRRSTGELVHSQTAMDGETVKVRGLSPAIYVGCLAGTAGRESCVSMDLNVPEEGTSVPVTRELSAPDVSNLAADRFVVAVARLAVPREASLEMALAERAQLQGDDRKAQKHLERAIQIHPDYPQALNNLGTHYYRVQRLDRSIELLTRATGLDPGMYAAWVNLAGSLISVMRFDDAVAAVQNALELRPNDPMVNSRAGLAYYYKRDYGNARKYFMRAMELDPAAASTPQLFLAHMALGEGRNEEAAEYLRHYLEVHPNARDAATHRSTLRNIESGVFGGRTAVLNRGQSTR